MHILALTSQKGGSGKTTLAGHLAVAAESAGAGPVALIDADPQASLTDWWNERQAATPAFLSASVASLDTDLARARDLGFRTVIIDTPPAMNFYSRSALIACDYVLIPFDCDEFARQALYTLLENIAEIREDHNEDLEVEGIVVNQFTARARLPTRVVDELRAEGQPVLDPLLSASVRVKESHEAATPLVFLDGSHKVTREYIELYETLDA